MLARTHRAAHDALRAARCRELLSSNSRRRSFPDVSGERAVCLTTFEFRKNTAAPPRSIEEVPPALQEVARALVGPSCTCHPCPEQHDRSGARVTHELDSELLSGPSRRLRRCPRAQSRKRNKVQPHPCVRAPMVTTARNVLAVALRSSRAHASLLAQAAPLPKPAQHSLVQARGHRRSRSWRPQGGRETRTPVTQLTPTRTPTAVERRPARPRRRRLPRGAEIESPLRSTSVSDRLQ